MSDQPAVEPQHQCWQQHGCTMDPACPMHPLCTRVEGMQVNKVLGPPTAPPRPAPAVPDLIGVKGWYLGLNRYRVAIVDGPTIYGPDGYGWVVWGRKRAIRRALRELAAYRDRVSRQAGQGGFTITQSEPHDVTDSD